VLLKNNARSVAKKQQLPCFGETKMVEAEGVAVEPKKTKMRLWLSVLLTRSWLLLFFLGFLMSGG
jgi:hypothetical protein